MGVASIKHVKREDFEQQALREIYQRFAKPEVVQLGARVIYGARDSVRRLFPVLGKFVGVDYLEGEGVDVVADCHTMSDQLGRGTADVIWSDATLEHLSHVWLAVAEMGRVLRLGGLTVHVTHQTFPVHGVPQDYWRFSVEAMKVLFAPEAGFRVLAAEYCWPVMIQPSPPLPAVSPCFVHTLVIAEKIGEPGCMMDYRNRSPATLEVIHG